MKYRDMVEIIEQDGWRLARTRGSHRHYTHPVKSGIVTVAAHGMGADIPRKILHAILKQAGLK